MTLSSLSNADDSVRLSVVNFGEKLPRIMHECITMTEIGGSQNIGEPNQNSALDRKYDQDDRVTGSLHSPTKTTRTHADVCENEWDTWEVTMSSYVVDNRRINIAFTTESVSKRGWTCLGKLGKAKR